MASKGSDISQKFAHLESNLGDAKRDLFMRFVRDQETLQTSHVDLKLVDDETIDLIDSALVANENEGARSSAAINQHANTDECSLDRGVSKMRLESNENQDEYCPEPPTAPRPPSGRPQSRRRKKSASTAELRTKRKVSTSKRHENYGEDVRRPMSPVPVPETRRSYSMNSPESDNLDYNANLETSASNGLNSSWPQEFLARKIFTGSQLRKYAICSPEMVGSYGPVEGYSGVDQYMSDGVRPMSTQSLRHITTREMIAARVRKHSATDSTRITCDIKPLVGRSDSPSKTPKGNRSRTIFNFGFEGPLELEPVHPSDLPMLRGASASSTGPYALVQLPPIARETPAATPPSS